MNIKDTTEALLGRSDVTEILRLADKYMEVYRSDRKRFSLPDQHAFLEPLIKYYAARTSGFAKYILTTRDSYPKHSAVYGELNKLYRSVFTRAVQQERRARSDYAVSIAIETYGPPPNFQERLAWIARREADWAGRRLTALEEGRNQSRSGRLSRDEINEVLADFWYSIDVELDEKGVPPWGE